MPDIRTFLCVSCPVGCTLSVTVEGGQAVQVEGNQCPLGVKYAKTEVVNPVRTYTSTVRVEGASLPVCPVRSRTPIPLPLVFRVSREVAKLRVSAPIEIEQVLIENVCDTGVDIIASRSLPEA